MKSGNISPAASVRRPFGQIRKVPELPGTAKPTGPATPIPRLSTIGVKRILNQTSMEFVLPEDRIASLAEAIIFAAYKFRYLEEFQNRKLSKRRKHQVEMALVATNDLFEAMSFGDSEWLRAELQRKFPASQATQLKVAQQELLTSIGRTPEPEQPTFEELLMGLVCLKKHLLEMVRPSKRLSSYSAFEQFVGIDLAEVFEAFFSKRAGRSRNTMQEPKGPYLRFVTACLDELRIRGPKGPYRPETIVRAISVTRTGRPRAKLKTV